MVGVATVVGAGLSTAGLSAAQTHVQPNKTLNERADVKPNGRDFVEECMGGEV